MTQLLLQAFDAMERRVLMGDVYRRMAADFFQVGHDDVTAEQRAYVKEHFYHLLYAGGECKLGSADDGHIQTKLDDAQRNAEVGVSGDVHGGREEEVPTVRPAE